MRSMAGAGNQLDTIQQLEGRSFGGYRIARVLATGGMATVFLARKEGPGGFSQTAAIKVIHPHLAREQEFVEMFLDEASIASCINHPNVCRVLNFGQAEGTYFLALEYVRGETWAETLAAFDAEKMPFEQRIPLAVHVVAQACEGLHAAHEALAPDGEPMHIVHRDVSPENLFVAYDGSVRVLDFGVAVARRRRHHTETGTVKGRYAYMAPEQMCGKPVDRRADVWSLAVVLREAIEGRHPFRRETDPQTIHAVTQAKLPAWSERAPLRLRRVLDRALRREPSERHPTARELGRELSAWLADEGLNTVGQMLGEHMQRSFAAEIDQKRTWLRELARAVGADPNPSSSALPIPPADSSLPNGESVHSVSHVRAVSGSETLPSLSVLAERRTSHRLIWPAVGVLVGLALLGGYRLWSQEGGAGRPAVLERRDSVEAESVPPGRRVAPTVTALSGPGASGAQGEEQPEEAAVVAPVAAERPATGGGEGRPLPAQARSQAASEEGRAGDAEPEEREPVARQRRNEERDRKGSGRERDEAAAEAAGPPGVLIVGARSGWAQVLLDGKRLGNTPVRVDVPSGRHTVTVVPFGSGEPVRHRVVVKPGESAKLVVELEGQGS